MDQPTAEQALRRLEPLVGEWTLEATWHLTPDRSKKGLDGIDENGGGVLAGHPLGQLQGALAIFGVGLDLSHRRRHARWPPGHRTDAEILDPPSVPHLVEQLGEHDDGQTCAQRSGKATDSRAPERLRQLKALEKAPPRGFATPWGIQSRVPRSVARLRTPGAAADECPRGT